MDQSRNKLIWSDNEETVLTGGENSVDGETIPDVQSIDVSEGITGLEAKEKIPEMIYK